MINFKQKGDTVVVIAAAAVSSGDAVLKGALFGIAQNNAAETEEVVLKLTGVWSLPKTTGEAWTQGQSLYWNAGTGKLTTTAGNNLNVAVAWAAAESAAAFGDAKINASGVKLGGVIAPSTAIPDLAAITGGEAPTEAEHNAVRADLAAIKAVLRAHNILAD